MASSQDDSILQESTAEPSLECTSVPEPYEPSVLVESCPAIPEPSRDESELAEDAPPLENPFQAFLDQPPHTPTFVPALVGSDSIPSFNFAEEEPPRIQMMEGCPNWFRVFYYHYSMFAIIFRNSRFFYIVQTLISLLPLSTIAMGIKNCNTCETGFPVLTLILGIVGALFIGVWISISAFHHIRQRCTGQQKFLMKMFFGVLTILLTIESTFYFSVTPGYNPLDKTYCSETFIDFTFYKYIAIGVSLTVALILYIPDSSRFLCSFECSNTNVPYDHL